MTEKNHNEEERRWYVVNTYSGHENRVKDNLEKRVESMGIQDSLFRVLVAEECVDAGCVGRRIASELILCGQGGVKLALSNLGDRFVPQGTVAQLRTLCGIDGESLCKKAMEMMADG